MTDTYPCLGPIYDNQEAAETSARQVVAVGRSIGQSPVDHPYTYLCVDGHWHYELELR